MGALDFDIAGSVGSGGVHEKDIDFTRLASANSQPLTRSV